MPEPLLTQQDMARHSRLAWACLAVLGATAAWFWMLGQRGAALGTAGALLGCLGLVLPPRERMGVLPWRLRALPRILDAAPVLATLISSPGYGLKWFYADNLYDEAVHFLNGILAGAVLAALLLADGRPRGRRRLAVLGAVGGLLLGSGWEVFEWLTGLIGDWTDTWTDVVLTATGTVLGAVLFPLLHHRRARTPRPGAEPALNYGEADRRGAS